MGTQSAFGKGVSPVLVQQNKLSRLAPKALNTAGGAPPALVTSSNVTTYLSGARWLSSLPHPELT